MNECIELCSAKVEYLRDELAKCAGEKRYMAVRNMEDETESAEYQAVVEQVRRLSPNWESWLSRKPSLESIQSLIDELTTDAQAYQELRILGGLTRPKRR